MSRIVITYSIFSALLFGALFSAFFISGLGAPGEAWQPDQETAAPADAGPPPDPLTAGLDYPALEDGRTYRVSHVTKLYTEPSQSKQDAASLPDRGFFTVLGKVDAENLRWYAVAVSDGAEEHSRYVLAKELNFKRVVPMYSESEKEDQRKAEIMQMVAEMGEQRRAERLAAMPPPEPEERAPETFGEWWSMTADRMGGAQPATMVVSAIAAGIGTVLTIGSILLVMALRREHTWDRAGPHDLDAEWAEATREDVEEDVYADAHSGGSDQQS